MNGGRRKRAFAHFQAEISSLIRIAEVPFARTPVQPWNMPGMCLYTWEAVSAAHPVCIQATILAFVGGFDVGDSVVVRFLTRYRRRDSNRPLCHAKSSPQGSLLFPSSHRTILCNRLHRYRANHSGREDNLFRLSEMFGPSTQGRKSTVPGLESPVAYPLFLPPPPSPDVAFLGGHTNRNRLYACCSTDKHAARRRRLREQEQVGI